VGTYCYVAVCRLGGARRFGAQREKRGGAYRGVRPPTACLDLRAMLYIIISTLPMPV